MSGNFSKSYFSGKVRTLAMSLGEIAAQAATSDEFEFIKFEFSCTRFVVLPSALQPYEGLLPPPEADTNLLTSNGLVGLSKGK